jgi:copper(I)-binding protein
MRTLPIALTLMLTAASAFADTNTIIISHAHARATVPGQTTGAVYLDIENRGKIDDKLLRIATPVAQSAEVHSMTMDGTIMRMREVGQIDLKPAAKISMAPNEGYHIMLVGLKQPLKSGQKIPLGLRFEKAGKIDIDVMVDTN